MESNKEKYRRFCELESSICIYDQAWWLDVDCGENNWDVLLVERGGEIVGSLPYFVKERLGQRYITIPFRSQHHGPWIKPSRAQLYSKQMSDSQEIMMELITMLEEVAVKCNIKWYNQTFSPDITDWLPFYWRGYKQTTLYTYRIPDIRDYDAVFCSFASDKRKNIRKAERNGIVILEDLPPCEFFELHQKLVKEKGKKIKYLYSDLEKWYSALYKHNAGKCLYAVDADGKVVGALLNAYDSKWGYDWISVFEESNSGASDLLVFSMIKYLSKYTVGYDFEGSMDYGIESSFRHLGGVQTPYFCVNKVFTKNPILVEMLRHKGLN